jgi:hypothetical protein
MLAGATSVAAASLLQSPFFQTTAQQVRYLLRIHFAATAAVQLPVLNIQSHSNGQK